MKKSKIKNIFIIVFISAVFLSLYVFHYNNSPKINIANLLKTNSLRSGDLVYRMNLFGVIPVASATFKAEGGHLSAKVEPLKSLQKFFKGSVVLDSYLDSGGHNPESFRQEIIIPGKQAQGKEVFYDQKNGIMTIKGIKRNILPDTQDPLSAVFNIRRMNLENISNLEMNINTNQKNYIFQAQITHQEISVNKNIYKLAFLKAEIRRRDKNPYHKSQVDIVLVENQGENIPVLIKVFASGFFLNARLIEIK
ncbi:MAG TPA: DUF3108 domain-containing protein [Candidatus Omnitrophota bacterium]|nr:DUF3108 domain-containing protein [Candidatus Omnitrophota bacterium]